MMRKPRVTDNHLILSQIGHFCGNSLTVFLKLNNNLGTMGD
jgi:hypothetical protein